MPLQLRQKLRLPHMMDRGLKHQYKGRYVFIEHHESHGASAFFPSPFEEAAVVTFDGVGEWATATLGIGRQNRIELTHELRFPHSLGLLYSAFTFYTGFRVNSGEYKMMGLAPYGEPKYAELIREKLLDMKEDGSFRMDMRYFNFCQGLTMTSGRLHRLLGRPPRRPEEELGQFYMDVAASIQQVTEEIMLRICRHTHELTRQDCLCLAGGVALNCVANGRILREGPFKHIWIQPAAGDAGAALGAALFVWYQLLGNKRVVVLPDGQQASLLGPAVSDEQVRSFLDSVGAAYEYISDEGALLDRVVALLAAGKVVGWFQGRMEFGPRALGCRSILGDARSQEMQKTMNLKVKFRESFRPFAPSVLREEVNEYFEMLQTEDSPYMLLAAPVRQEKRTDSAAQVQAARGLDKLPIPRSVIPAVTHVDYSARVQTVDEQRHGLYYQLLRRFRERTGCAVLVNTSFNVRGEPIVCYPEHAHRCFMATNMDALVLEHCLLLKEQQPDAKQHVVDEYLAKLQPD